jgi:large subunit ribosomal protein L15
MRLNELSDNPGSRKTRKRIGRGQGSGKGGTCGRGHKGQKSRSGVSLLGFEGGQMPLYRRLPKRGFHNPFRKEFVEINLGFLQKIIDAGKLDPSTPVNEASLKAAGLIKNCRHGVKLLAKGDIKSKLTIEVTGASKAAIAAVEKAGGKVVIGKAEPPKIAAKAKSKAGKDKAKAESGLKTDDQAKDES